VDDRGPLILEVEGLLLVEEAPVQARFLIEPKSAVIHVGEQQVYKALLRFSDGLPDKDVTEATQWSISRDLADEVELRPNQPINRAEAMALLIRLLRGLGW